MSHLIEKIKDIAIATEIAENVYEVRVAELGYNEILAKTKSKNSEPKTILGLKKSEAITMAAQDISQKIESGEIEISDGWLDDIAGDRK